MRYSSDHKVKAKAAILKVAERALRAKGFNGIGVDGVAAAAGVTSGAFYSHFVNKEALLEEVIALRLGEPFVGMPEETSAEHRQRLRDYLKLYISLDHSPDHCDGCVMPTLSSDVSRADVAVRKVYERKMIELISKMSQGMKGPPDQRERKAWTVLSIMVGAVSVAQALPAGDNAEKLIAAALESAIRIMEQR